MANNSMSSSIDGSPSKKQRTMEGSDDETLRHVRPLVSIDFVRVKSIRFEIDDKDRREIDEEDKNEIDDEDRNKLGESDDEDRNKIDEINEFNEIVNEDRNEIEEINGFNEIVNEDRNKIDEIDDEDRNKIDGFNEIVNEDRNKIDGFNEIVNEDRNKIDVFNEIVNEDRTKIDEIDEIDMDEIDDEDMDEINDEDMDEIDKSDEIPCDDIDDIDGDEYKEKRDILDGILRYPSLGGTVIVTDCLGDALVFHQYAGMSRCHLPLPLPEQLSLNGPRRAISGKDRFYIRVGFWSSWPKITKQMCNGEIVWDPDKRDQSSYDKPLEEDVCGEYGSVTVGYSVIREALSATIDVVWMNKSKSLIYGTVKAVQTLGGSSTTRILFDRSANRWDAREVYGNYTIFHNPFSGKDTIPFPVQMHSNLTIMVDLMDHLSHDRRVRGSVEFTPKFGRQEMNITGKHSEVQVSITCE